MTSSIIQKEEKDTHSYKVTIRVYGCDDAREESHSYLIDDMATGVSSPIGTLAINIRSINLTQVRPMIEYDRSNQINRRTLMFQEALFIMSRLPNPFHRPLNDMKQYRFGFIKKDKTGLRLIKREDEDKPIADLIGAVDFFEHDLCIVPLSQLPVEEQ
jgi:hypothetical protein